MMAKERLHKVLAHAGFGSRRACEQLIRDGLVQVDGRTITEMGVKVDPGLHKVKCQGRYLRPVRKLVYLLNKPRGVLSTTKDERGRRTVMHLMVGVKERLYPVGRLDAESQGMVLMTNDGDLTDRLTHPRYGVARTYHVVADGKITQAEVDKMSRGVWLAEGKTGPLDVKIKGGEREFVVLEVTLHEGMNREVRRVLAKFGLKVRHLKRIRIGDLALGTLPEGRFRPMLPREIEMLFKSARVGTAPPKNKLGRLRKPEARTRDGERPRDSEAPREVETTREEE